MDDPKGTLRIDDHPEVGSLLADDLEDQPTEGQRLGAAVRPRDGWRLARGAMLAFAIAFAVRLPYVNAGLFHHDEVQLARAVEQTVAEGHVLPAVKGRYGAVLLNVALYAPYHAWTGRSAERVVPFTGILTGALLVAFVLLLAEELTGDAMAGALAAAFTGASVVFLTSSSTGKENAPQMAFAVLAAWLAVRGVARGSMALRFAGTAVFAFALTVHEGGILLVPPYAVLVVALDLCHRRGWRSVALDLAALAAALVVPIRISIWEEIQRNLVPGTNSASFLGLLSSRLPEALRDLPAAFGTPVLALAAVGLAVALRRRDALLALAPWVLVLLYFGNVNSYVARYLLYVLPPFVVFAGAGGAALVRRWAVGRERLAATLLALATCAPGVARAYPLLEARAGSSGPKAMALLIKERTEPDAVVLCMDDAAFVEYYAGRQTMGHPADDPAAIATFVRSVAIRGRAGTPLYASQTAFTYDNEGAFGVLVSMTFELVPVGEVTNEWYYRPELAAFPFRDVLYRLVPR